MTDFRACGTIMGPAGLTAVFGMGTGVAPRVWSPESNRRAQRTRRSRSLSPALQQAGGPHSQESFRDHSSIASASPAVGAAD
jgi:hypothetical protein